MQGSKSCPHKEGPNRVSTRGLMKAAGFTSEEIAQPFVGIACSWTDAFPGHNRLNQLAEDVARGVIARGGTPMIFHTIAICDGYCGSTEGAKYSLPSREVICDSIECEAAAHGFDAMVFVAACDKIVPGMLMAAARLNSAVRHGDRRADAAWTRAGGRGTAKSLHHSAARGTIQPGGDQRRTPDGI